MEKLINANEGFGVLDRLFAKIQKNNYKATQQMLDEAWSEWIKLDEVNVNNRRENKMEARQKNIFYNLIVSWFEDSLESYDSLQDEAFVERVCRMTGLTKEEYDDIVNNEGEEEKINVEFNFNFEADVTKINPKDVDIEGLAKELAFNELKYSILNGIVTEEDFEIVKD